MCYLRNGRHRHDWGTGREEEEKQGYSFGDFGCVKREISTIDKGEKSKKNTGCISWCLKEKCELEMDL